MLEGFVIASSSACEWKFFAVFSKEFEGRFALVKPWGGAETNASSPENS